MGDFGEQSEYFAKGKLSSGWRARCVGVILQDPTGHFWITLGPNAVCVCLSKDDQKQVETYLGQLPYGVIERDS